MSGVVTFLATTVLFEFLVISMFVNGELKSPSRPRQCWRIPTGVKCLLNEKIFYLNQYYFIKVTKLSYFHVSKVSYLLEFM